MTRRIAAVTAASSSAGRSIIGTAPDIKSTEEMCEVPGTRSFNAVRENAHTLSDFRVPTLSIECEPCGRRGRYNVARLMEKYGDAKLPELLQVLAQCHKDPLSMRDRCRVRYGEDSRPSDLTPPRPDHARRERR
jgi:hypothetical protein